MDVETPACSGASPRLTLAQAYRADNQLDKARRTLEEVAQRFPTYKGRAETLLHQLPAAQGVK